LIALLDIPPLCKLHEPAPLRLTIRNRHPSSSANIVVQLLSDPADAFVVSGLRTGRVPLLLPQSEEVLTWKLIPIECGYVQVPRFKVLNRRRPAGAAAAQGPGVGAGGADGGEMEDEVVRIIDWRCDKRSTDLVVDGGTAGADGGTVPKQEPIQSNATVLVLP
jgi:trafficking protein particle complex subunit 11